MNFDGGCSHPRAGRVIATPADRAVAVHLHRGVLRPLGLVGLKDALEEPLGRKVDLVAERSVQNPYLRRT